MEVSIQGHPFLGNKDAPLVLVEFSDYQCPFCRRYHLNTFPDIKAQYIDTGKLRYVVMDLPLAFHANAQTAANAANCANDQGRFWELRHLMLENATKLSPENIEQYARQLHMDMGLFKACQSEKKYQLSIDADVLAANQAGITGTPSFILSSNTGGDKIRGQKVVGAKAFAAFKSLLDAQLRESQQPLPENSMNSKSYRLQSKIAQSGRSQ